jgi:hypothetical protein
MTTKEMATEIFLRATERERPGVAEDTIRKLAESAVTWAQIAAPVFDTAFPEAKPVEEVAEVPSRIRPGVNRETTSRPTTSSSVDKPVPLHDAGARVPTSDPNNG